MFLVTLWTTGINAIVESIFCAFYSLLSIYHLATYYHSWASSEFWQALAILENYLLLPIEEEQQLSTWLLLLSTHHYCPISIAIQDYHSHWQAWIIYLLISEGVKGAISFAVGLPCCFISESMYWLTLDMFIVNWNFLSVVLFLVFQKQLWQFINARHPAYVPRRQRGYRPLSRKIANVPTVLVGMAVKTTSLSRALYNVVAAFGRYVLLVFHRLHEAHDYGVSHTQQGLDPSPFGDHDMCCTSSCEIDPCEGADNIKLMKIKKSLKTSHFGLINNFFRKIMIVMMMSRTAMAIAYDTDEPAFALQHIMFCLRASSANTMEHRYDSDSFIIAIDNCSSKCITNNMSDYVSPPTPVNIPVRGIGGTVTATFKGTVNWSIEANDGVVHTWKVTDVYFNASSPYRLLSPQHWAQSQDDNYPERRGTWCGTYDDAVELFWKQNAFTRTIPLSPTSNIALVRSAPKFDRLHAFCSACVDPDDVDPLDEAPLMAYPYITDDEASNNGDENDDDVDLESVSERLHPDLPEDVIELKENSSDFQDKIADWTQAGINLQTVKPNIILPDEDDDAVTYATPQAELLSWHYRLGHLSFERIRKLSQRGDLPGHLAQAKTPRCAACMFGKATRRPWRTKAPINKNAIPAVTTAGDVVGVDQLISSTPGLVAQMRGILTRKRYTTTTVFVDHFSNLSFVHHQLSTAAVHTIEAKRAFERFAKLHGVTVRHYHSDNGVFDSKAFVGEVHMCGQTISFCAVNAHHQNGKAEKKIRDLQEAARTMILHAKQRWPSAVTVNLWPYALRMANDIANSAPSLQHDQASPLEMFAQTDVSPRVKHVHTFGSPVYVLDSRLQAGRRVPKWERKARVGMYLGSSPRHSRKVALVLSLVTGLVSPQFHCQFDDHFDTLKPSAGNPNIKSHWQAKAGLVDEEKPSAALGLRWDAMDHIANDFHPDYPSVNDTGTLPTMEVDQDPPEGGHHHEEEEASEVQTELPQPPPEEPVTVTRYGRVVNKPQRLINDAEFALSVPWEVFHDGGYDIQDSMEDPIAFALAASSNPDIMYLDEAMRAEDSEQFRKAMADEVKSHDNMDHWKVMKRADLPAGTDVLPAVWAMRRKRRIATQEVYKWKARLNVHGGKQTQFVNYWETYSPVVGWTTIRTFLILMVTNHWVSRQVDFVLAFPQADIECEMYMEVPQGFHVNGSRKDHCLRLDKNLYGTRQAGRVWNIFMHNGLIARGFRRSEVDMCVYYRGNVVLLVYVDDGIFIGPNQKDIQIAFDDMANDYTDANGVIHKKFIMTDEGELSDYLGVKIEQLSNGTIKLSQPHLIQQILDDLGFNEKTKLQKTPAATTVKLHRDPNGKPHDESWHYRSVIGKLNFLEKSTRLDLSYAVHQCARFSAEPKESHANAVKRIGRYLIGTKNDGIILNPKEHSFDCFVDADFVGNWHRLHADVDPGTAKSRTGYVIMYAGCPVVWASRLQREVALSTTEAEYNALSESLREVRNMMQLLDEAKDKLKWTTATTPPKVHCKVFEDNSGALEMVRLPKMRPRTKHICVRMHHFREYVRSGKISIHKVPSKFQLADIATKPQPQDLFQFQREALLQWESEHQTREELQQPGKYLRACDIVREVELLEQSKGQPTTRPAGAPDYLGLLSEEIQEHI